MGKCIYSQTAKSDDLGPIPKSPQSGRRRLSPASCPLTATHMCIMSTHTHTQARILEGEDPPDTVVHTCDSSTQEAKTGGSQVQAQLGLQHQTLSQNKTENNGGQSYSSGTECLPIMAGPWGKGKESEVGRKQTEQEGGERR